MKENATYFPENRRVRVLIDSDAACECDDNYAILHAMMSKKADLRGVIAAHFGAPYEKTMEASFAEITKLMTLTESDIPVYEGQKAAFSPEETESSPGVSAIIKEALVMTNQPLFVICQGALTNLATALCQEPSFANRLTAVIFCGRNFPSGGFEVNARYDPAAFNFLMASDLPLWIIPEEVYSTMQVSFFEVQQRVAHCGAVGAYLWASMQEANKRLSAMIPPLPHQTPAEFALSFPSGESWSLGDSAGIGVLLSSNSGKWKMVQPPMVGENGAYTILEKARPVRWYEGLHERFIIEDFLCKLKYYFG